MDGCCLSRKKKERLRIHKEIERQLKLDRTNSYRELKLLLLGTAESGKSTFMKQMRIAYGAGYSEDDRRSFTKLIYQNIFQNIKVLIQALEILKISFVDAQNIQCAQMLSGVQPETVTSLEPRYADAIKRVWADHGVQECYSRRREYQLSDSAKYFLNALNRLLAIDYLPTVEDIIRLREPTTSITEYSFNLHGFQLRMVDMGAQRSAMRKWIHYFENVTSVIFLVALSDYDQVLCERDQENRMMKSKALFKAISSSFWFSESSIILFLNKTDLLEEKILHSHLADFFPEYSGPKHDAESAKNFIQTMFKQEAGERKFLYSHFTCAIDQRYVLRDIFADIKDSILRKSLEEYTEGSIP